jgi:hypothetical protein
MEQRSILTFSCLFCKQTAVLMAVSLAIDFWLTQTQEELRSNWRAATLNVVMDRFGISPLEAKWCFAFNTWSLQDKFYTVYPQPDEVEIIPTGSSQTLWSHLTTPVKFKDALVKASFSTDSQTLSVALQPQTNLSPLMWVQKTGSARRDLSHFRLICGRTYRLIITFGKESSVPSSNWQPLLYISTKRVKNGVDEIVSERPLTSFKYIWLTQENTKDQKSTNATSSADALKNPSTLTELPPMGTTHRQHATMEMMDVKLAKIQPTPTELPPSIM